MKIARTFSSLVILMRVNNWYWNINYCTVWNGGNKLPYLLSFINARSLVVLCCRFSWLIKNWLNWFSSLYVIGYYFFLIKIFNKQHTNAQPHSHSTGYISIIYLSNLINIFISKCSYSYIYKYCYSSPFLLCKVNAKYGCIKVNIKFGDPTFLETKYIEKWHI